MEQLAIPLGCQPKNFWPGTRKTTTKWLVIMNYPNYRRNHALSTRAMAGSRRKVFQRVQLHHVAHRAGGDDGIVHLVSGRSDDDTPIGCVQNRPVDPQRRAANASGKSRHAA